MNFIQTSFLVLTLLGGVSPKASADTIKLAIAGAPMQNIFAKIREPYEKATGDKLEFVGGEGLTGEEALRHVESGDAEGGAIGTAWENIPEVLKQNNFNMKDLSIYTHRVIGSDIMQFYVNKSNKVNSLSLEQLAGLLSGKISNWSEVGGANLPVKVVLSKKQISGNTTVKQKVLGKTDYVATPKWVPELDEIRVAVAAEPGGIGFNAVGFVNDSVRVPTQPEIGRPLTFFTKGQPAPKIQRMLKFIQGDGLKYHVRPGAKK